MPSHGSRPQLRRAGRDALWIADELGDVALHTPRRRRGAGRAEATVVRRWGTHSLDAMQTFLAALVVLPYDQRVATRWGEIQAYAQLRGRPRPANDSWIAVCCLVRELPLATFNTKDYADFAEREGLELAH